MTRALLVSIALGVASAARAPAHADAEAAFFHRLCNTRLEDALFAFPITGHYRYRE